MLYAMHCADMPTSTATRWAASRRIRGIRIEIRHPHRARTVRAMKHHTQKGKRRQIMRRPKRHQHILPFVKGRSPLRIPQQERPSKDENRRALHQTAPLMGQCTPAHVKRAETESAPGEEHGDNRPTDIPIGRRSGRTRARRQTIPGQPGEPLQEPAPQTLHEAPRLSENIGSIASITNREKQGRTERIHDEKDRHAPCRGEDKYPWTPKRDDVLNDPSCPRLAQINQALDYRKIPSKIR